MLFKKQNYVTNEIIYKTINRKFYRATTIEEYSDVRNTMYISISTVVLSIWVFRTRGH